MRKSISCLVIIFIIFFKTAHAEESAHNSLTLNQAIKNALENNPEIAEFKGEVTIASGLAAEAGAGYWPKFQLSAGYTVGTSSSLTVDDELIRQFAKSAGQTSASEMIKDVEDLAIVALMLGPDGAYGTSDDIAYDQAKQMLESTDTSINPLRHKGDASTAITITNDELKNHIENYHSNPITWEGDEYYFDFGTSQSYPLQQYSWDSIYATSYASVKDLTQLHTIGDTYFGTQVSFVQPIYTFGKLSGYNQAAKMKLSIAEKEVLKKSNEVIKEVTERYYQVLLAQTGVEIATETVSRLKATMEITKSLLNNGSRKVSTIDLLQNEIYLHKAREKMIEAQKGQALAESALNFSMGRPLENAVNLAEHKLAYEEKTMDFESLKKRLFNHRPEWGQLNDGVKALEANLQVAKSDYFPMIGLTGEAQYVKDNPDYYARANPDPIYKLTLGVTYESFDFFMTTNAKIKQAEGEVQKIKAKQQWAQDGMAMELKKACLTVQERYSRIKEMEQAVTAAVKNYRLHLDAYQIGMKEFSDVVQAQVLEAEIKFSHQTNIFEYLAALAELDRVVGDAYLKYQSAAE